MYVCKYCDTVKYWYNVQHWQHKLHCMVLHLQKMRPQQYRSKWRLWTQDSGLWWLLDVHATIRMVYSSVNPCSFPIVWYERPIENHRIGLACELLNSLVACIKFTDDQSRIVIHDPATIEMVHSGFRIGVRLYYADLSEKCCWTRTRSAQGHVLSPETIHQGQQSHMRLTSLRGRPRLHTNISVVAHTSRGTRDASVVCCLLILYSFCTVCDELGGWKPYWTEPLQRIEELDPDSPTYVLLHGCYARNTKPLCYQNPDV